MNGARKDKIRVYKSPGPREQELILLFGRISKYRIPNERASRVPANAFLLQLVLTLQVRRLHDETANTVHVYSTR